MSALRRRRPALRTATALLAAAIGVHLLMIAVHSPLHVGSVQPPVEASPVDVGHMSAVAGPLDGGEPDRMPHALAAGCLVVLAGGLLLTGHLGRHRTVVGLAAHPRLASSPRPPTGPPRTPLTPVTERVLLLT